MKLRVYLDTSVIGGCFDIEFSVESHAILKMAKQGKITLLVSDLLLEELTHAPENVKGVLPQVPVDSVEQVIRGEESRQLLQYYMEAGILSPSSENDAHHVALATIARADVIASWNFAHIVNFKKIRLFNAVNLREGYPLIDIRSPSEVVEDEETNEIL